ncbi:hypothetical protein [Virgibacillus halodenitrificans]|uniref:hypothetical protein n=1 Tax=Virgibacillus halodenitrificans TaxID=1482 RepID=UPI000EF545CB|nr:hypothetical protein [Virgibacillus halodenitrificans]
MEEFQNVTYLGLKGRKNDEMEFFVSFPTEEMISCKTSIKNNARKDFLETLHIGTSIKIQAEFLDKSNIHVLAFMI